MFDAINKHKWYCDPNGYAVRNVRRPDGTRTGYKMHWVVIGKPPKGMVVDHKNGNGIDNRKCNLRFATFKENCMNSRARSTNEIGLKGVSWNKDMKGWAVQILVNGKQMCLGYFDDPKEAHEHYKRASVKYHGEFSPYYPHLSVN